MARWAADVPEGFRFAAKAHRRLTHVRSLPPHAGGAAFLEGFLASLAPLGGRLGAVLFQFPPARERDDGALGEFLACLPPALPFAVEFRHESWLDTGRGVPHRRGRRHGLRRRDDRRGAAPPAGGPARLRPHARASTTSPRPATAWRDLLEHEAADRPVYAFTKHEGVPAGDPFAGVGLAEWLVGARD